MAALIAVIILVAAACGESEPAGTSSTTSSTSTTAPTSTTTSTTDPTSTTTTPPASTTSTTTTSTTTTSTTTTSTTQAPPTSLPGEPIDIPFAEGDVLAVIGVTHDDVLNVRNGPGVSFSVVTTLGPTSEAATYTGEARSIPGAIWLQVEANGTTGWANSRFLAILGATDDVTSAVVDQLGEIPTAATMAALGDLVAESQASDDPPSTITMTVAPTTGDLGEVTYDVVGLGDDAARGFRLHVFGEPDGGGFSLKSVESTVFCARGVTDDGICV